MRPEMAVLARALAREIMKYRDTLDGFSLFQIGRTLTIQELCEVGRAALLLIDQGEVS